MLILDMVKKNQTVKVIIQTNFSVIFKKFTNTKNFFSNLSLKKKRKTHLSK